MATLKDIAKLSNVSISTASRVLNQDSTLSIPLSTRNKVLAAAEKLNYKKIKTGIQSNSYKIAMIHWYTREQEFEDTYYLSIRLGIENACYEQGIELVKVFYDDLSNFNDQCDGAIAVGKFDESEIKIFKNHFKHIVFVDSSPNETEFDSVVIDFEQAYLTAINYLESLGYKDIGYIGGREYTHSLKQPIGERREKFFSNYFNDTSKMYIGSFNIESGYTLMKKAIDENNLSDAYLIASDPMAIGALRALYEANIKVPDDVSIIGFNDIPQSAYTIPPLTTIKVFKDHMGKTAVSHLIERINGRNIAQKVIVQTKLIIRNSTKDISGK